MQSGHTGNREIFTSGAPQRRQSEGNSAANKPWATVAAPRTAASSRVRRGGAEVRVMSPVLLKTSLPRPAPGQAPAGRIALSIAGSAGPMQLLTPPAAVLRAISPARARHQQRRCFCENNLRNELVSRGTPERTFPGTHGGVNGMHPNCRSPDTDSAFGNTLTPPDSCRKVNPDEWLVAILPVARRIPGTLL